MPFTIGHLLSSEGRLLLLMDVSCRFCFCLDSSPLYCKGLGKKASLVAAKIKKIKKDLREVRDHDSMCTMSLWLAIILSWHSIEFVTVMLRILWST